MKQARYTRIGHRHVDHEVATSSRYGDDHRVISQARLGATWSCPKAQDSAKCLSGRSRSFPDSAACHPKCHAHPVVGIR
jgi:hypothetical protein